MILGVGVDIVEVARIQQILSSPRASRFIRRVFTAEEIRACAGTAHPAQGYAARFAAKEAVAKALGTGFRKGVTPNSIMVKGGEFNQPAITLTGTALEAARALKAGRIHVSLTHSTSTACALVVVEKSD